MNHILFSICISISLLSKGQEWTALGNTRIQKISIKTDWGYITHFRKDSAVITVPDSLQDDFTELFLDNNCVFDSIANTCAGIMYYVREDSLRTFFKKSRVTYLIYFTNRIVEIDGDKIIWGMTSLWGQGQLCWPVLYFKWKTSYGKRKLQFISIDRGLCDI